MVELRNPDPRPLKPVCSVCIANYNGEAFIAEAIESIHRQSCDFPVEIIVHDDASTDGSIDLIRAQFPEVRLLASPANVGFCVANNRMVAAAAGEFVLLLNNDAALFPDALALLHHTAVHAREPLVLGLPQYSAQTGRLVDRGSRLDFFFNAVPNTDPQRCDVAMVIGACLWAPKSLWNDIGGFPEFFGSVAEDTYFCSVARLYGFGVRVAAASGFRHRVGSSFGGGKVVADRLSTTYRRRALSERNRGFVRFVVYPPPVAAAMVGIQVLTAVIEGLAVSLLKRNAEAWRRVYLPAVKGLFENRQQLLRLRRKIHGRRRLPLRRFLSEFVWVPQNLRLLLKHGIPDIAGP